MQSVTRPSHGVRLLLLAATSLALTACGNSSLAVTGALRDAMITQAQSCNDNGTQEVDLTNASGTVIARDTGSFTWQGGECVIPFSFSDVPHLATYGLTLPDGNGSTLWLTPQQAAKPINLSEGSLVN